MWILQIVIPFHQRAVLGVTTHELDRFGHHVDDVRTAKSNAVLRLQPKDPFHRILLFPGSTLTPRTEINLNRLGAAAISSRHQITPDVACARASETGFTGEILTT